MKMDPNCWKTNVEISVLTRTLGTLLDAACLHWCQQDGDEVTVEHIQCVGDICQELAEPSPCHDRPLIKDRNPVLAGNEESMARLSLTECHTERDQCEGKFSQGRERTTNQSRKNEALHSGVALEGVCAGCINVHQPMDPVIASCLMHEIRSSQAYRKIFLRGFCEKFPAVGRDETDWRDRTGKIRLEIGLTDSKLFSLEPDIRWSKRMLPLWLVRMSMDDAFSWLSTLGGAFSALGDDFQHFADKAGRVSLHQMKLAFQMGDPILQARCKVYIAQSLLQKGFIRQAMAVIRQQYRYALSLGEHTDVRLINMCRGVWSIIQYTYMRKKERRNKGVGLKDGTSHVKGGTR